MSYKICDGNLVLDLRAVFRIMAPATSSNKKPRQWTITVQYPNGSEQLILKGKIEDLQYHIAKHLLRHWQESRK